jgi:hypothetical protein
MAWAFGDGFDLYTNPADMLSGYWDSGSGATFVPGRFAGSPVSVNQAISQSVASTVCTKSSAVNDAVHHLMVAFQQTQAISGSTLGTYLQLLDGTTAQVSIVFRSDGAILLTSGAPTGTVLATFTGAFPLANTWYGFEFEVVINNTNGSFVVRKNGNTSNDFTAGSLNTRVSANNYANKLTVGMQAAVNAQIQDDLFWKSDASSVPWMGDLRCFARMPLADVQAQFAQSPNPAAQPLAVGVTWNYSVTSQSYYFPFVAAFTGAIGSVTLSVFAGVANGVKLAIFSNNSGAPGSVLGTATPLASVVTGSNMVTFPTPAPVTKGVTYYLGLVVSGTIQFNTLANGSTLNLGATSPNYAAFPVANPTINSNGYYFVGSTANITVSPTSNSALVGEYQEDGLGSTISDSNAGDFDLYSVAGIGVTPYATVAVTTRALAQKSSAGNRTLAVQLKSGATIVASPTVTLSTSGWLWAWRTDTTDPATSAAWTATAVNNAQIGPKVIA